MVPGATCQHRPGVLVAGLASCLFGFNSELRTEWERKLSNAGVNFKDSSQVKAYLGERVREQGLECSRLLQEFLWAVRLIDQKPYVDRI